MKKKQTLKSCSLQVTQQGEIKLHFHDNKVKDIVEYSLKPFERQFQDKEIQLEVNIPEEGLLVHSDIEKTVWVLMNIIGNAFRYSHRWGKVIVETKKKKNLAEFMVRDFGEGMQPEHIEKAFHSSIRSPQNPDSSGIGLALPISREIIEAQGGSILAESKIGEGSSFYFTLPLSD